ncbi:MAG: DUF4252 domain-containing protein, partial [Marinirhabdus sp.]
TIMVTVVKYAMALVLVLLACASCSSEKSLQKYLVEKQDDPNFVKVDVATSLFENATTTMGEDEKEVLKTLKKINIVAYPIENGNVAAYKLQKDEALQVLSQEKYKMLMKMGSNKQGLTLKYLGEDDSIDELIVFGNDNKRGFAIFRLLGENMEPEKLVAAIQGMDMSEIELPGLGNVEGIFSNPKGEKIILE